MSTTPTVVAFSMADEYVPATVDKTALVNRMCAAMSSGSSSGSSPSGAATATPLFIEGGDHALSVEGPAAEFAAQVCAFAVRCSAAKE